MKLSGRILLSAVMAATTLPSVHAQSESFADFRKKILNDFNDFRTSVLEDYDKFLEGAWKDYDQIKGEKSNPKPKPRKAPVLNAENAPAITTTPRDANAVPAPTVITRNDPAPKPAKPTKPAAAARPATPAPSAPGASPATTTDSFTLAEIPLEVPHIEFNIARRLNSKQDFGAHWRGLSQTAINSQLIPAFSLV